MDQNEFLGTQWLKDETDDTGITMAREGISAHFGWADSDWYQSDERQLELFEWLNSDEPLLTGSGGTRKQMLDQLASLSQASERATWLTGVEREAYWAVPENRYQEPEYSEDYGMTYRYDNLLEIYQWQHPDFPGAWMSQEEADAQIVTAQQAEGAEYEYSEAAWDENWQMLYRTNRAGVYEYAYSDDQRTIRPGTEWLSYAQVMQEPETPPQVEADPVAQLAAERSSALERTLAEIRQSGLSHDDITDEQVAALFDQYVLEGLRAQQQ